MAPSHAYMTGLGIGRTTMNERDLETKNDSCRKRRGASLIEFGVLVGLVAVVAIASVSTVGSKVSEIFGGTANAISQGMNGQLSGGVNLAGGVAAANQPPVFVTANGVVGSVRPGVAAGTVAATLAGSDSDGDALSFSGFGLPSWLTINSNGQVVVASGQTPPNASSNQSFPFTGTVSDGQAQATGSFSVTLANSVPVVTTPSIVNVLAGAAPASLIATDADNDVPSWLISGSVPGLTLNSNGSWTGTATTAGTYATTVTANDGKGGAVSSPVSFVVAPLAFSATGGSITTSGGYVIHTFTTSGTFQVTAGMRDIEYLVVAGGGGGGSGSGAGGGGAGGMRTGILSSVGVGSYAATVGAGGAGGTAGDGAPGNDSVFSSITSIKGGGGSGYLGVHGSGLNGGSGGGANYYDQPTKGMGTVGQGYNGGTASFGGGGGGGAGVAGSVGGSSNPYPGGTGGLGASSSISGSSVFYAGGGGGGCSGGWALASGAAGGNGGGGTGASDIASSTSGAANSGGGGGGGGSGGGGLGGGGGGSGIVIIRYLQ